MADAKSVDSKRVSDEVVGSDLTTVPSAVVRISRRSSSRTALFATTEFTLSVTTSSYNRILSETSHSS